MILSPEIKRLIEIMSSSSQEDIDTWPLKPIQLFPYIDMDQCLDLHHKIKDLEKRNISKEEVANVIFHPTTIRYLIANVLCTGLKVAKKLNIENITSEDSVNLVQYFIDILKIMSPEDPLCESGKNLVLTQNEIQNILDKVIWLEADNTGKNYINALNVDLIAYTWAFYWPYFPCAGYETYGPYNVSSKFGRGSKLLIKDYFNLKPIEIWSIAEETNIKSIRIYQVYLTEDLSINTFGNRILSNTNLPSVNTYNAVEVNGEQLLKIDRLEEIGKTLELLCKKQTSYVNSLNDLDKVRKGSMLSFYTLKDFYIKFWDSWFNPLVTENTIQSLEDKFIKMGVSNTKSSTKSQAKVYDPSSDYF